MQLPNIKNQKIRILFVCLGNICRSPAAEGIMKKMIEEQQLEEAISVDSAGTSGWHQGELPDCRMCSHGQRRGYDFSSRSRKIESRDLDTFDYIVVMDNDNYRKVARMATNPLHETKIHRMVDYSGSSVYGKIPDPYYGGDTGFELVMDLLEDACTNLLDKIKLQLGMEKSETADPVT